MTLLIFTLFLFCVITTAAFAVLGGVSDFRGLVIPNLYSLIVLACFAVAFTGVAYGLNVTGVFHALISHLSAAGVIFVITMGLYVARMIGAGDSKFATALALWAGLEGLSAFLFFMAVMGGVLAAFTLYFRKSKPFKNPLAGSWIEKAQNGENSVPYGIAIAAGALVALLQNGFLSWQSWELILNT